MKRVAIIYNAVIDYNDVVNVLPQANHMDYLKQYEIDTIANILQKEYAVSLVPFTGNVIVLMKLLEILQPHAVFNLFEGVYRCSTSEIFVPITLDLLSIPYTGNSSDTLKKCLNKSVTKLAIITNGILSPEYQIFKPNEKISIIVPYPLIVKPIQEDASIGITKNSICKTEAELITAIEIIWKELGQPAIAEGFIDGRELNVAILCDEHDIPQVLPISEIDFSTLPTHLPNIVTYNGKWEKESEEYKGTVPVCPAKLDADIETKIKEKALKIFNLMGCRDYARVDFRLSKEDGELYVIDVNPNPDISRDAGFARSAGIASIDYETLILHLAKLGLRRINS